MCLLFIILHAHCEMCLLFIILHAHCEMRLSFYMHTVKEKQVTLVADTLAAYMKLLDNPLSNMFFFVVVFLLCVVMLLRLPCIKC